MPVHGLWDVLRSGGLLQEAKNGEDLRRLLEGKTVAVDLSIWAVEGQERSLQIEARGGRIWPNYYLLMSLFRTVRFLRYGCFPVGVVEGACPASKEEVQRAGRQPRQTQRAGGIAVLSFGGARAPGTR